MVIKAKKILWDYFFDEMCEFTFKGAAGNLVVWLLIAWWLF